MEAETESPYETARGVLAGSRVAVIATSVGEMPWASTVYYASDGFDLYINTPEQTRMLRNMLANPHVAYTVDDRTPTLFVQGEGMASVVPAGAELERASALIRERVPEASVGRPGMRIVKIVTDEIYLSDFREGRQPRKQLTVGKKGAQGQHG